MSLKNQPYDQELDCSSFFPATDRFMRIVHTACSRQGCPGRIYLCGGSLFSDLTCGIRMLYVDDNRCGIDIFPNRKDASGAPSTYGTDGWDLWGWTSPHKLALKAGKHKFTLKCEPDADNMSLKVNDFMLKGCRLTYSNSTFMQ